MTNFPLGWKIIPPALASLGLPFEVPSKKRVKLFFLSIHWRKYSLLFLISQGWISRWNLVWGELWFRISRHQFIYSGLRSSEWRKETILDTKFSWIMLRDLLASQIRQQIFFGIVFQIPRRVIFFPSLPGYKLFHLMIGSKMLSGREKFLPMEPRAWIQIWAEKGHSRKRW